LERLGILVGYKKRKYERFLSAGEIRIADFNKEFISYEDAKLFIKKLGIFKYNDWKNYKKIHKIKDIPTHIERVYSDKYINWKTFIE